MKTLGELFVSVIIPVRNDPERLDACLSAVMQSSYACYECIVIDDHSDDDRTHAVITKYDVRRTRNGFMAGPAFSRNKGAELANGEILFFVDADVQIRPDTIAMIVADFEKDRVDAVIGSYDSEPANPSFFSQYKNLFHHYVHQNLALNPCTFWAGCGAIRKMVFDTLGGFDENYRRPAIEDIDLGMRLSARGGRIKMNRLIMVKHLKRWTFWSIVKTDILDRGIPWTELLLSKRQLPNDLNVSFSQRVSVVLAFFFLLSLGILSFTASLKAPLVFWGMAALVALLAINRHFYRFFVKVKGVRFAISVIPMHILYFLYCGISFGLGIITFYCKKLSSREVSIDSSPAGPKSIQPESVREFQNV